MARVKDYFEYFLARSGMTFANLLTPRGADLFGAALGWLSYHLWKSRRDITTDNLNRALGDCLSDEEINVITKNVFQNVGRTLVEFIRFNRLGLDGLNKVIIQNGIDQLTKAHQSGRGGILLTAHFGNWEMIGAISPMLGYETHAIVAIQHNPLVNRMITKLREKMGLKSIFVGKSTLRDVVKALHANQFIGIVADQHDPSEKLILDFFGRKATVPRGPALFAIKTGCPILPYLLRRDRYDRHVIIPGEPIYPPDDKDLETGIREMSLTFLKFFEDTIRKYPDQWMWTHRRWKI